MQRFIQLWAFSLVSGALGLGGGCSASQGGNSSGNSPIGPGGSGGAGGAGGDEAESGGTGGAAGQAGVGGLGGVGGMGGTGGTGGTGGAGGSGGDAGSGGDTGCAARSLEAENILVEVEEEVKEKAPVALYFMLDQSLSMLGARWDAAVQSMTQFVDDPQSEGLDVALQYFPLGFDACDGSMQRTPETPMGRLPGHAQAIKSSLSAHGPFGGGTPIEAALRGLVQYCDQDYTPPQSNPEEKCIAVLITDGAPSGCDANHDNLVAIAANASSRVFTIGMQGADFNLLDRIAEAGEGDCTPNDPNSWACDASQGSSLADALLQIRDTVTRTVTRIETREKPLECEWKIPDPPEGETFDRNKVNVRFTAEGVSATDIGRVDEMAACASASEIAWHYDDPDEPTRILACPNACEAIQSASGSKVDIVLGCETYEIE